MLIGVGRSTTVSRSRSGLASTCSRLAKPIRSVATAISRIDVTRETRTTSRRSIRQVSYAAGIAAVGGALLSYELAWQGELRRGRAR
mgnify:CR=1 FL=1